MKAKTLFWVGAIGAAGYAAWRWQMKRFAEFDKNMFSGEEGKKLLGANREQPKSGNARPVATTVHRGAPPRNDNRRPVTTTVHKGEPPKHDTPPPQPRIHGHGQDEDEHTPPEAPAEPQAPEAPAEEGAENAEGQPIQTANGTEPTTTPKDMS